MGNIDYLAIANAIWDSKYKMSAVGWRDCFEEEFSEIIKLIIDNAENPDILKEKLTNLYKYHPSTISIKKSEMKQFKHCYMGEQCNCYLPDIKNEEYYCNIRMEEKISLGYRGYPEYIRWRKNVLERDNYTCQGCGITGVELDAHHIKDYKNNPKIRTDINNGITLCKICHRKEHSSKKRGVF